MLDCFSSSDEHAVPIVPVPKQGFDAWFEDQAREAKAWIKGTNFRARPHTLCLLPNAQGDVSAVLAGVESEQDMWALAGLPDKLPPGNYRIEAGWTALQMQRAAVGWGLGTYQYRHYKQHDKPLPKLFLDPDWDAAFVEYQLQAVYLVRDLVNTPAADMMPEHLAEAAERLAEIYGARFRQIVGYDLIKQNYPAVHAVGRASTHAPRLLDLIWGEPHARKVTLVGKGVCFDTGGLDIKPPSGMRLMKKDMGGAAHALGLARLIMSSRLPVRLRVLIPAVDNAISGNAFRPGDVITTRNKITVEIENTDAEGRLVMCDALAEAADESPLLIIDFATLTGAARIALGTELPAFFTHSELLANSLMHAAEEVSDPVWRLPLHKPYRYMLDSDIADIANAGSESYAGAITAALFLQGFVPRNADWVHFDGMDWNLRARPGRPKGGEAMGLRAAFEYLRARFARG